MSGTVSSGLAGFNGQDGGGLGCWLMLRCSWLVRRLVISLGSRLWWMDDLCQLLEEHERHQTISMNTAFREHFDISDFSMLDACELAQSK